MDNYTISTVLSLCGIGLACPSLYIFRERNKNKILVSLYKRFLNERDSCYGDFTGQKYRSIVDCYVPEFDRLDLSLAPIARRTRKRMIETIKNPPPVLSPF